MLSYLEAVPCDVLEYIALLTTIDSYMSSAMLKNILALLLTSSTLYHSLCLRDCPHLYADIFRSVFDVRATLRRFKFQITDSALAGELVLRCRMLKRVRSKSISRNELHQDLWTAFLMIQESDGINEQHLRSAGLADFLVDIVKHNVSCPSASPISFVLMVLHQEHVLSLPSDLKEHLQSLLFPHSLGLGRSGPGNNRSAIQLTRFPSYVRQDDSVYPEARRRPNIAYRKYAGDHRCEDGTKPIISYGWEWVPSCPDLTPAAVSLIFCLTETTPIAIPDHLPENRSIAIATQRFGPTKEDIRKIRGYKTRLFADTAPRFDNRVGFLAKDTNRSLKHDIEFRQVTLADERVTDVDAPCAMYGLMTGIWEGFYMVSRYISNFQMTGMVAPNAGPESQRNPVSEFICRKPLQCALAEFVCFDNKDNNDKRTASIDVTGIKNIPRLSLETATGFELDGHKYERLTVRPDSHQETRSGTGMIGPAEILLLGETLEDHEEAWSAFRFAGCVRRDGSILLKREPKETGGDAHSGAWIFEGRLCFGTVFVGAWYLNTSSVGSSSGIRGIFSMQKRASGSISW